MGRIHSYGKPQPGQSGSLPGLLLEGRSLQCISSFLGWTPGLVGKILILSKVLGAADFSLRHHRTKSRVLLLCENKGSVCCN